MFSEEEITLTAIAILESALRSADPDAVITAMVSLLGDTVWTQDGMMSLVSVMMVLFTTLAAATDATLASALLASIRDRTLAQAS